LDLVHKFEKATKVKLPYAIGPRRAGDVVKTYANPKKANKILGWKSTISIDDALLHSWEWQKKLTS
jgi:UDP-glucose 4-epimerase